MGSVSQSAELGLALRTGSSNPNWIDPSGIRSALRHRLTRGAGTTILVACVIGLATGASDRVGLLLIAGLAVFQVVFLPMLQSTPRRLAADLGLRVEILGWSISLAVLTGAGRGSDEHLFEMVSVVAFALGMFVALTERRDVAVVWGIGTAFLVAVAAVMVGGSTFATAIVASAVLAGAVAGDQSREALEGYLGARGRLMREVSRVPVGDDPFVTAELLLHSLTRWTPLRTPSIVWFRRDGHSIFLGVAGDNLPPTLQPGLTLPEERNQVLRTQAESGPWISGWVIRPDDQGYSQNIANLGIHAIAYVPMLFEGRVIGLVAAGLTDRADDRSAMAEYIPTLVQFADAAVLALGPTLTQRDRDAEAHRVIDEVLAQRAYRPVFQPVQRLGDGQTVGYEALTRFDTPWTPTQVFSQARLAGRLRELELATLRAAIEASEALPSGCWLSLNCSADLIVDVDTLAAVLEPAGGRELVLELSEQDVINDYGPIREAFEKLGPSRRLAVDDAGAGFASLRHILEVRPHFVKLDLGLVQGVGVDITRTALVAGFVRFAVDAGFELIAEGIETEADQEALKRLGVAFGQGYLLARPAAAAAHSSRAVATHGSGAAA